MGVEGSGWRRWKKAWRLEGEDRSEERDGISLSSELPNDNRECMRNVDFSPIRRLANQEDHRVNILSLTSIHSYLAQPPQSIF
jgi:hypothetical protein